MPWTDITRPDYDRRCLRYASDATHDEWELIAPFVSPASNVGRPRLHPMRQIWNAISCIAATRCQWAMLPKDFPPFTTVQYHFYRLRAYRLRDCGLLDIIKETLVGISRLVAGRKAEPTAAIIDSRLVKTTESGGISGFDAGKKVKGRKRHIATDTQGNLLYAMVPCAGIQDRDGAPMVIEPACQNWPTLSCFFADGGYAGWKLELAVLQKMNNPPQIEIVRRPSTATGFVVITKRWVVERTCAWPGRCRRLAKDRETSLSSSNAWLTIAAIRRPSRFIAKAIKSMT